MRPNFFGGQIRSTELRSTKINEKQARTLREEMEVLAGHLASVRDGWEDEEAPMH
jgi:hypothetical protein